jgi:hypothetical protein
MCVIMKASPPGTVSQHLPTRLALVYSAWWASPGGRLVLVADGLAGCSGALRSERRWWRAAGCRGPVIAEFFRVAEV